MDDNFSSRVKDVIAYSKEEALRLGHNFIGTEHLMLGMIRDGGGKAISILKSIEIDLDDLRKKVEILNPADINDQENFSSKQNLHLTRQAERALKTTFLEAKLFQSDLINTVHLLLCILRNENDPTTKLLSKLNINYDNIKEQFKLLMTNDTFSEKDEYPDEDQESPFTSSSKTNISKKTKTPVLDNFGRDITDLAINDKLDPVVGREKEIERVSQILSRLSLLAFYSHQRRVVVPIGREGKNSKIRQLNPSSIGFLCPMETPEGQPCGIVKNWTLITRVSNENNTSAIIDILEKAKRKFKLK